MRIALVVLGLAVLLYFAVQAVERRRAAKVVRPAAPPVTRSSPRAEQDYQRTVRERVEQQRRGTPEPAPEPEPPAIVIDEGVFASEEPNAEYFVVSSPAPTPAVVAAVERASLRFMLVDELGREHADHDALALAFRAHTEGDLYTPNYAADPVVTDAGVEGYIDCKGGIDPAMGQTFRRVLREELEQLGAPAQVRVLDAT